MTTRRGFLIGASGLIAAAASNLILPSWIRTAERFIDIEDAPLLEAPPTVRTTVRGFCFDVIDEIRLVIGEPYEGPPRLTWFEFFARYYGDEYDSFGTFCEEWCGGKLDPFAEADDWAVMDAWLFSNEAPDTHAYAYLEQFDIGPELGAGDTVGRIEFVNGPCPGNDSRFVSVPDLLSLSLPQKRLNQIGADTQVEYLGVV